MSEVTIEFISLAFVIGIALLAPVISSSIPNKPIPETVFLIILGAIAGPYVLDLVEISTSITLLKELGLGFLFLLAGYEINPKSLANKDGKSALATWFVTLVLAFCFVMITPGLNDGGIGGIAFALALTSTALGTLLPILKERNMLGTRVGDLVLTYGTWGEICPIIAISLLLSSRSHFVALIIIIVFIALAILTAVLAKRAKRNGSKLFHFIENNTSETSQVSLRATIVLLIAFLAAASFFDLDIILGAFAAGFILRYIAPLNEIKLEQQLTSMGYGFFIPLFFVVSGAEINLAVLKTSTLIILSIVALLLLVRAVPIFVSLTLGKTTRDMSRASRLSVSIYCTTALPLIVAVTSVAMKADAMTQDNASILVLAGAATVLIMPFVSSLIERTAAAKPLVATGKILRHPNKLPEIIASHRALERALLDKVEMHTIENTARKDGLNYSPRVQKKIDKIKRDLERDKVKFFTDDIRKSFELESKKIDLDLKTQSDDANKESK